ncbi:MAG: DNA polymerase III subunit delta [Anaerolineae bacterium]|jgi:DNA polymerase III subunit delta|nr:DNA polymerase III subunit delta [Anaerolineae bacterium]MBT7071881.1 DNA polymerase III subunit delta [Anaerolineae bacterium]MBT7326481.1 DNA polymerase III subunit delta [Anaerolineae bacterium]
MSENTLRILFVYGNDEFAISRRLQKLQQRVDKDGMNTSRLEARTMSKDELNMAVNAMPFLAERRLVLLEKPSARYTKPKERKEFLRFLETVPPSTVLALFENVDEKKTPKHWLVKWAISAKEIARAEAFMLPKAWKTGEWIARIQKEAKSQGGEIENRAAARLAEMVGQDTRQTAQEITKLLTYANFERAITLQDIELLSVSTAQGDVFALVDALGNGQGKAAQAMLHRLLEEQDAFSIFGMVVRQFRLLLLAREVIENRGNVQTELKVHSFVAQKLTTQARHFSLASLEAIYQRLLNIDEDAKTSQVSLDLALDIFVMELAGT